MLKVRSHVDALHQIMSNLEDTSDNYDSYTPLIKYAPGGFTLEMGELAKSGYAAFVAALPQVYMKCSFTAGASKADTSHLQSGMLKK